MLTFPRLLQPYRFFIADKQINKGRNLMILQLAHEGKKPDEILRLAGGTPALMQKTLQQFEEGKQKGKPDSYVGVKFDSDETLNRAFGAIYPLYVLK